VENAVERVLGVSALHYSTGSQEGFLDIGFSLCAAPDYLLLLVQVFQVYTRSSKDVQKCSGVVQEFGS